MHITLNELPKCPKCKQGILVPIEDWGTGPGHSFTFIKCWVCFACNRWVGHWDKDNVIYTGKAFEFKK